MQEYGFWDYTAPGAGGMEHYQRDDHLQLLDDMAQAGMNSLVVVVKWMTTGYRSQLEWLDQEPDNAVILSDNELIRFSIDEAHKRGIKVWLGAVVTEHVASYYGKSPHRQFTIFVEDTPREVHTFDLDMPDVEERSIAIFEELSEQFPNVDGLLVELEFGDTFASHRVDLYNLWAKENDIGPGNITDCPKFQQYATFRRCEVLASIRKALKSKGFTGDLSTICEVLSVQNGMEQVVDLLEFSNRDLEYSVVTYGYDSWNHNLSKNDHMILRPREYGLRSCYLARGVMTWNGVWRSPQPSLPVSLSDSWAFDIANIQKYKPDGFWWFGTGAVREGANTDINELKKMGFADGRAARTALLSQSADLSKLDLNPFS